MPYRRSTAKKDFDVRVADLHKTTRYVSFKATKLRYDVRDLAFHAVILQLSSCLEEYIATLIRSWFFQIKQHGLACSQLPLPTRAFLISSEHRRHYAKFLWLGDEKQLLRDIAVTNPEYHLVNDDAISLDGLSAEKILSERKYPSTKNLPILFSRIGLDNIFDLLGRELRRDAVLILKSFNDMRTSIAHVGPSSLTAHDVERYIKDIRALARGIDRIMYKNVRKCSGETCWA